MFSNYEEEIISSKLTLKREFSTSSSSGDGSDTPGIEDLLIRLERMDAEREAKAKAKAEAKAARKQYLYSIKKDPYSKWKNSQMRYDKAKDDPTVSSKQKNNLNTIVLYYIYNAYDYIMSLKDSEISVLEPDLT